MSKVPPLPPTENVRQLAEFAHICANLALAMRVCDFGPSAPPELSELSNAVAEGIWLTASHVYSLMLAMLSWAEYMVNQQESSPGPVSRKPSGDDTSPSVG